MYWIHLWARSHEPLPVFLAIRVSVVVLAHAAFAQGPPSGSSAVPATVPEANASVVVTASKVDLHSSIACDVDETSLATLRPSTSDTAILLRDVPGVSLYGAGGVSSLPAIHGLADDRLRINVDGMDLLSACLNHMNSALSMIDPTNVASVKVFAGITPVSAGGDSIGGAILVSSASPEFAKPGQGTLLKGEAGSFYRSNGNAWGASLSAVVAGEDLSLTYNGSLAQSRNYTAAREFKAAGPAAMGQGWLEGDVVGSSKYRAWNHDLGLAFRQGNHLVELKLGLQDVPDEGFPNQRMDITGNDSKRGDIRCSGQYPWGVLEARATIEKTQYSMNCGAANLRASTGFVFLQYANQSARLHGLDVSGHLRLARTSAVGSVDATAVVNYVRGENRTTGDNLYNIMPLNVKVALVQRLGGWAGTFEAEAVAAKTDVSQVRNEVPTAGYAPFHGRASYVWKRLRLDLGIENLFDTAYSLPLGGAYVGQGMTMSGSGVPWGVPVPGPGRLVYAAMSVRL